MANGSCVDFNFENISCQSACDLSIFWANTKEKEFIEFALCEYIESGVDELSLEKLPDLLKLKYLTLPDAIRLLGDVPVIRE